MNGQIGRDARRKGRDERLAKFKELTPEFAALCEEREAEEKAIREKLSKMYDPYRLPSPTFFFKPSEAKAAPPK